MNQDYNYYTNQDISEEERRDVAFQTVNAVRESVTLARNSTMPASYELAFRFIYESNENLYNSIIALLTSKNENELVKYYKEEAQAMSTIDIEVSPIDLIIQELNRVDELIAKTTGNSTYLIKKKFNLVAAKEYFTPRMQSEHKSLNHDFYLSSRSEYFGKALYENDSYKDFKISKDKVLRLRLLHPDNEETILGVDLIYETFDLNLNKVRFAHMQYKTWNDNVLYNSQSKNLLSQLEKMEDHLCLSGYCKGPTDTSRDFRFPYCSGFLRPTSKLQKGESKLISTGLHLPICQAITFIKKDNKISKADCKEKSIKGHIFEELFTSNLAGSRWISIDELDNFYNSKNILSHSDRIRIHAQEIIVFDEYKKNKDR